MLKAEILIAKQEFGPAIELLDQLIQEEPKAGRAHYLKGLAHFSRRDGRLAQAALAKSLELEPGNTRAHLLLAEIYLQERDGERARKEAEAALKAEPQNYQARMLLGNILLGQQKYPEAQAAFEALVKAEPNNPAGYFRLGALAPCAQAVRPGAGQLRQGARHQPEPFGRLQQRRPDLRRAEEVRPGLRPLRAAAEAGRGDPGRGRRDPQPEGRSQPCQERRRRGRESFRTAIELNPNLLAPYYALAGIYLRDKKEDKAIGQFERLIEVNPKQAGPHMMIAVIYDSQKKFDLSEKHYRSCLEIDPRFAPAANNLAYILVESNRDLNEALKLAQKAKEILPEEPSVMDTLGWVYYKKGLYDSAIGEFKASLAKAPDNPVVAYHLGLAHHKKGEADKARAELTRALRLSGSFDGAENARKVLAEL